MAGMGQEFKAFVMRGNVLDLAVGVVIGAAFGKIVTSLSATCSCRRSASSLAGADFSQLGVSRPRVGDKPAVVLGIGKFIQAIVDFLIIAFAIFLVVKAVNRMKREEPPPAPAGAVGHGAAARRDPRPPAPGTLGAGRRAVLRAAAGRAGRRPPARWRIREDHRRRRDPARHSRGSRPIRPRPGRRGSAARCSCASRPTTGLVGWARRSRWARPRAVCTVVHEALRPLLLGQPPTEIERLADRLQRGTLVFGRRGLGMFAISGVELALWDLAGQARGVPVYELLGGLVQPRIPAYASLLRFDRPADVARAAAAAAAAGVPGRQAPPDRRGVGRGRPRGARAGRGADAGRQLPLDAGRGHPDGRALAPFDLAWLEEPVWPPEDYPGLARVAAALRRRSRPARTRRRRWGSARSSPQRAADILQPSPTKVGGLGEVKKIAALAATHAVPLVPHSFYFGPGLAAALHLAASTPGVPWVEWPMGELATPLLETPIRPVGGLARAPPAPGSGRARTARHSGVIRSAPPRCPCSRPCSRRPTRAARADREGGLRCRCVGCS